MSVGDNLHVALKADRVTRPGLVPLCVKSIDSQVFCISLLPFTFGLDFCSPNGENLLNQTREISNFFRIEPIIVIQSSFHS